MHGRLHLSENETGPVSPCEDGPGSARGLGEAPVTLRIRARILPRTAGDFSVHPRITHEWCMGETRSRSPAYPFRGFTVPRVVHRLAGAEPPRWGAHPNR